MWTITLCYYTNYPQCLPKVHRVELSQPIRMVLRMSADAKKWLLCVVTVLVGDFANDENGNRNVDPAGGVSGISVRAVAGSKFW